MVHPDLAYTVAVGYATGFPIIPDERTVNVAVMAPDDGDARLFACQMVYRLGADVLMVTRATILTCIA